MGQSESKVLSFLLVTGAVSLLGKTAVSLWRANREGLPGNPRIEEGSWVWVLGSSLVGLILLSVVVWLQRRGGKSGKGKPGDYVSFERQFAILFMVRGFLRRLQTAKIRKRKEEQLMELNAHFKPVVRFPSLCRCAFYPFFLLFLRFFLLLLRFFEVLFSRSGGAISLLCSP